MQHAHTQHTSELDARFLRYVQQTLVSDPPPIQFEENIRRFLEDGANPDQYVLFQGRKTPIIMKLAEFNPELGLMETMLEHHATPTLYDGGGRCFLHRIPFSEGNMAAWLKKLPEIAHYFDSFDIPIKFPNELTKADHHGGFESSRGQCPLHVAVDKDCLQYARTLIHLGASVTARDSRGNQPIHIAARGFKTAQLAQLAFYNAELDAENKETHTAQDFLESRVEGEFAENAAPCLKVLEEARRYPWLRVDGEITREKLLEKDAHGQCALGTQLFATNFVQIMGELAARGEKISGRELIAHSFDESTTVWKKVINHSNAHYPRDVFGALHYPGRPLEVEDITDEDGELNRVYAFIRNQGFLRELFGPEAWAEEEHAPEKVMDLFSVMPPAEVKRAGSVGWLQSVTRDDRNNGLLGR